VSAAEILEQHARRPVRAFLRNADVEAEEAFWRLVYADRPQVDHATALSVHNEILNCPRPVQDVIDGWRPEGLQ